MICKLMKKKRLINRKQTSTSRVHTSTRMYPQIKQRGNLEPTAETRPGAFRGEGSTLMRGVCSVAAA